MWNGCLIQTDNIVVSTIKLQELWLQTAKSTFEMFLCQRLSNDFYKIALLHTYTIKTYVRMFLPINWKLTFRKLISSRSSYSFLYRLSLLSNPRWSMRQTWQCLLIVSNFNRIGGDVVRKFYIWSRIFVINL